MLTFNSAQELAAAPVNPGVRFFIATCTDRSMLTKALELERAKPDKRLVRLVQIQDRLAEIGAAVPDAKPVKPVKLDPKLSPGKAVAKNMTQAPTIGLDDFLGEMMGDRRAPVTTPAPVTRAKNAATVLMASILDGNAVQLAAVLRAVASGDYDMDELALKLVERGADLAPMSVARPPHMQATGPSEATMEIARMLVRIHSEVTAITPTAMTMAGAPDSWFKYRAPWYPAGTIGKALRQLGYVARCRTVNGDMVVTLIWADSEQGQAILAKPQKA